ncbi:MAG: polyphosphate kinase 2 family protein [Actinobacteria bacterium]|nr:polyphosphate kinase 2 family protein [Actinomycetota bacterium]MCI0544918.1 polyphosphate kinase 2 family protein [Actinomycetota bacterium]
MLDTTPFLVGTERPFRLADHDPAARIGFEGGKHEGRSALGAMTTRLAELQRHLWAEGQRAVLVVLQAMDTGGKDGTIRHVFSGVNPQGVRVWSFGAPTELELAHDYLWRVHLRTPERGTITIFNRSHYEDVIVVRVRGLVPEERWARRFEHIRQFERMLADEGTVIVKVFINISKEEQRVRLQKRLDDPEKRWKFRRGDLDDRRLWDPFQTAYEEAVTQTSTEYAPWYVVPGDRKWYRNLVVSSILVRTLEQMDPRLPPPEPGLDDVVVQ